MIIQDQFSTIQKLQRALIPKTSNWSGTIFGRFLQQTGSSANLFMVATLVSKLLFTYVQKPNFQCYYAHNCIPKLTASGIVTKIYLQDKKMSKIKAEVNQTKSES